MRAGDRGSDNPNTCAIKVKLFIASVIMATIQDVQKKIGTKFKTLKLLEKDTLRIYERNKESELNIRELFRRNQQFKDGNSRGNDRKQKHRRRN